MMKRLASIDVLRAIAILLMIQVHFVENLSPREASSAALYDLSEVLGMLPAPLFTFLVGLSLWLWLRRETGLGRSELELSKVVVRRGLFLSGAGLAFAVVIWLPEEVFDWDILTLLGASTLIGFLLQGYFPLLPWVVFPLVGFATGKRCWGDESGDRLRGWGLPVMGLGLVGLAGLGGSLSEEVPRAVREYISGLTFYPASTTYVVGGLGVTLLGLWVLNRALDSGEASPGGAVLSFLRRYSRFSLTTYMVHHAVHVWPLLLLAAWEGKREPWWYYGEAVSTPIALMLALLFIAGFYGVLVVWERRKRSSFEGALRWLSEG